MIDKIKNFLEKQETEKEKEHNKKEEEYNKIIQKIKELTPKIKELTKIYSFCEENNFEIDDKFISNGMTHELGFYRDINNTNPLVSSKNSLAIQGGGWSGYGIIVNINGQIFPYTDNDSSYEDISEIYNLYMADKKSIKEKLKQFIDNFDKFEKAFYDYIDNIVGE